VLPTKPLSAPDYLSLECLKKCVVDGEEEDESLISEHQVSYSC
jgi:hypothetical protein